MKLQTIWFLTIIMSLTLAGLLYVQIMYVGNMVRMRDDQFAEGVKRSLYGVATHLEQDETRHFLEDDLANIEVSFLPQYDSDGSLLGTIKTTYTSPAGQTAWISTSGDLIDPDKSLVGRSSQEVLRRLYRYQKSLLNEVILNILNQSSERPIEQRADSADVGRYLQRELANNGLDLPHEYALVNRGGIIVYKTGGYEETASRDKKVFSIPLFVNEPGRHNSLRVCFPTRMDYVFSSVKFMVPSLLFTLILILVFVYTIIVAFRQKRLTEEKTDFINNITHELKTPISSISLAGQMLQDTSVRKSEHLLNHISTVVNDETKRLRQLVEKVLWTSLQDSQRTTLKLTTVDANELVEKVAYTFKLKVENLGGSITTRLEAADAEVTVDEMHLTNVISNLLDNAIKYRCDTRPLNLTVATADISGSRLRISVADNGIGIKRDNIKKIFEKFYRVNTGNRHDVKGFGLGLYYAKKVMTDMGGEISAESESGVGTTFNILLPLTQ